MAKSKPRVKPFKDIDHLMDHLEHTQQRLEATFDALPKLDSWLVSRAFWLTAANRIRVMRDILQSVINKNG